MLWQRSSRFANTYSKPFSVDKWFAVINQQSSEHVSGGQQRPTHSKMKVL